MSHPCHRRRKRLIWLPWDRKDADKGDQGVWTTYPQKPLALMGNHTLQCPWVLHRQTLHCNCFSLFHFCNSSLVYTFLKKSLAVAAPMTPSQVISKDLGTSALKPQTTATRTKAMFTFGVLGLFRYTMHYTSKELLILPVYISKTVHPCRQNKVYWKKKCCFISRAISTLRAFASTAMLLRDYTSSYPRLT